MGIDRIGKGTPATPPTPVAESPKAGAAFEVQKKSASPPVHGPDAVSSSSPLARLRAGEIDLNRYLDLKVEEATAHLRGLSPVEMGVVQKMLRDQLVSDPALSDLVQQATGRAPTPPEE